METNLNNLLEYIILESVNMFRTDKTDIPYYDGMLKNPEYYKKAKGMEFQIEYMRPQEYLELVAKDVFKTSYKNAITYMLDDNLIKEYKEAALNGDKFPMLIIDYSRNTQEGRHRAYVAELLNIRQVPVMIVNEV